MERIVAADVAQDVRRSDAAHERRERAQPGHSASRSASFISATPSDWVMPISSAARASSAITTRRHRRPAGLLFGLCIDRSR